VASVLPHLVDLSSRRASGRIASFLLADVLCRRSSNAAIAGLIDMNLSDRRLEE